MWHVGQMAVIENARVSALDDAESPLGRKLDSTTPRREPLMVVDRGR